MIEIDLVHYLSSHNFKCGLERQKNIDVILEKTGGQLKDHQFLHIFAIQTYGSSKQKAAELAYQVMNVMLAWMSNRVANVVLNAGPYDFTDTSTKEYRYQAVYEIYEF
ncbi:hypothetical protein J2Z60_000174 [Lactobacillus colini]|uniref:Phage protein n=1 Tax=Lactobacillus colini TaxID=1819254 RepID=A0ABS4MBF8_9LACO|nr:hypothetical protein [Lactobacillus colini]MBP2057012.1 hypothetical protein [Lactobacillus colini]